MGGMTCWRDKSPSADMRLVHGTAPCQRGALLFSGHRSRPRRIVGLYAAGGDRLHANMQSEMTVIPLVSELARHVEVPSVFVSTESGPGKDCHTIAGHSVDL